MHTRLCFCIFTLIRRAGARNEGGEGRWTGESACARVLFWYFFNNLHFTHALAWKAEWEWRQRSLNKWSVCAYLHTYVYIRTYCTNMSVRQCDRSIEIWIGMNCAGQGEWGQGLRYEVWIGYGNGNECTWRVRVSASSTSYTALATYQKFLCGTIYDSCSSAYVCVRMCVCVCVCENLWRARKLCATYAKSLPKDLQKKQKKTNLHAATVTLH